jgi:ubiquinone/menaquinone biosynthesis C-methylase UbiE
MEIAQKNIFIKQEANDWFRRNLNAIKNYDGKQDPVCNLIQRYNLRPDKIFEIGCSAGHRLAYLKTLFPEAGLYGIEPSTEAIEYGKSHFHLDTKTLFEGTAENLSYFETESFDLVIIGFVFYVIDRELLLKVIGETDRVLKNNGLLLITDFFAPRTLKNEYHHLKGMQIFTYKQKYEDIFLSSGIYHLIAKDTLNHTGKSYCSNDDFYDKYIVALLKKSLSASYE